LIEGDALRGGAEYSLYTWSLEWMARWLLSFGPDAEAIAPAKLRKLVRQEARAVLEKYGEC
jgi:predicted DNA-binding transcriptional regulator YafY